jgi:hypothetical protein
MGISLKLEIKLRLILFLPIKVTDPYDVLGTMAFATNIDCIALIYQCAHFIPLSVSVYIVILL